MEKFILQNQLSQQKWLGEQTQSVVDNYKRQLMLKIRGDIELGLDNETQDPALYSYKDDTYYVLRKEYYSEKKVRNLGKFFLDKDLKPLENNEPEVYYEDMGSDFSGFSKLSKNDFNTRFYNFGTYLEKKFRLYSNIQNNIELLSNNELLKKNLLELLYFTFGSETANYIFKLLEETLYEIDVNPDLEYNDVVNNGGDNDVYYLLDGKSISTEQHILFMMTKLIENEIILDDLIKLIETFNISDFFSIISKGNKYSNPKLFNDTFELVNLYYVLFFDKEYDIKNLLSRINSLIDEVQTKSVMEKILSIKSLIEGIVLKIKKNNE